jgi:hypothetical protein
MNKIIWTLAITGTLWLSQPVDAQTQDTTDRVSQALKASFVYDLEQEAKYTKDISAHQLAIANLRKAAEILDKARDPINQIVDRKIKGVPNLFIANLIFEDAKRELETSRRKYGIRWGDWEKWYKTSKK